MCVNQESNISVFLKKNAVIFSFICAACVCVSIKKVKLLLDTQICDSDLYYSLQFVMTFECDC